MNGISIEEQIKEILTGIASSAGVRDIDIALEIPRNREFGDLSSNFAMTASRQMHMAPRQLAQRVVDVFPTSPVGVETVEIAGPGFLNFRLASGYFHNLLTEIAAAPPEFGNGVEGQGQRWLFEYVSANPTGPLNVVSARAATIGSTLTAVFRKRGFHAEGEFYVNDGGRQVNLLGASVRAHLERMSGVTSELRIPEDGYHGAYVADIAEAWRAGHSDAEPPSDDLLGRWAADWVREGQERTLKSFGVHFDGWFRESAIYQRGGEREVINQLTQRDAVYEKDGALFFTASRFGDTEDRVLRKSDGGFTYVVPDIAYHLDKFNRGFTRAVDLLGPDHHAYIDRMRAALKALGIPDQFFHAQIVQQVNLSKDGREVKMSKRAGVGITLDELVEEVGVDAARFFFLRRKISSPLDFDIDLAVKHSDENPVFYVQYAHARIRSILRQPGAESAVKPNPALLTAAEELEVMRILAMFPWTLAAIVRGVDPHPLTGYLIELARAFHLFYTRHRVISDDRHQTAARLLLCTAVAGVLAEGLRLMGVSAPDKM